MPIPASAEWGDFEGSSKISGREGHSEIVGFEHMVYMPMDRKDGTASGTRVHKDLVLVKNFDKASPKLAQYLCNGKTIPSLTIHWFEIDETGTEKEYFTHTLEKARVTKIEPFMPDVDDPKNEQYKHMEKVGFRYEKITWTFVDGNVEYTDSWIEGR